jgi:hypothetical protein
MRRDLKPRIEHLPRVREAEPNRGLFAGVGMGCGLLAGLVVGWAALRSGRGAGRSEICPTG